MSSLPPISLASSIIGFISFTVTLLTLLRVTWDNLSTLSDAPSQVHFSFANLKQAIYEERAAVHRASRLAARRKEARAESPGWESNSKRPSHQSDGGYSGANIKVLQDTVRKLCRDFKRLERPFLRPDLPVTREGWEGPEKKVWDEEVERYRYREEGFAGDYCDMTIGKRFVWLRSKSEVDQLWTSLQRLQMRRMAREVTEALSDLHVISCNMRDLKLIQDPRPRRGSSKRRAPIRKQSFDESETDERIHVRRSYAEQKRSSVRRESDSETDGRFQRRLSGGRRR